MYVDSLACVRVKGCESERFRIDSGMRQGCIIPLVSQCIFGRSDEGGEDRHGKAWREWKYLTSSMYRTWFCVVNRRRT